MSHFVYFKIGWLCPTLDCKRWFWLMLECPGRRNWNCYIYNFYLLGSCEHSNEPSGSI